MAVKMLTVIINDPQGQMSKEQVEQAVISTLNSRRASDSSTDYMADTFIVRTKEQFYVVDDKFKQTLNASSNVLQSDYITSKQLEEKLAQLKVSEDNGDVLVAKGVLLSSDISGQNENFKTNQAAIILSTTKDAIEVSANLDDLVEYPSSNEAQGTGKWIGIGIDTGKPSIIGVSVDDYELQQIDIDEAKAVGLNDGSFVFWFKAEQDYTRELVLRSGELERSVSVVFKNASES